jgi:capsular polysaccharide biosynthesis protein
MTARLFFAFTYRRYLSRYIFFRALKAVTLAAYRSAHRLRSYASNLPLSGNYQLCALSYCSSDLTVKRIAVDHGEVINIPAPTFTGYCAEAAIKRNPAIKIEAPSLEVFEFSGAMAVGGVDFVFINDMAIHHNLFAPTQHHCPAENVGVASINRINARLDLYLTKKPKMLTTGTSMIGQCSGNYAHWLTETLPKLTILDACEEFYDLPLLVDDDLHPNIYSSLNLVNRNRREVIKVKRWEPAILGKLVTISNPGYERYAPHDFYSREAPAYVNTFSRTALLMLRDTAGEAIEGITRPGAKAIYLARSHESGNIRQLDNSIAVEAAITANGISMITPESMSFVEQVTACADAKIIVAPIGASLANMIFAPQGCKVIILAPYYEEASYFYYSNLAGVLGHELHYVLGPQTNVRQHPIHRNYCIDVEVLSATLKQVKARAHED